MPFLGTTGGGSVKQYGGQANLGYFIKNSVRLRSSVSGNFSRTPSAGTRTTWTWSTWVKRGSLGIIRYLFNTNDAVNNSTELYFNSDDTIKFREYSSAYGGYTAELYTTQVFRDPSAWYHIVFVWDSNNGTSGDRVRLYINGTRVTAFSTASYPSSARQTFFNSAYLTYIGANSSNTVDGYLAEINFIDGQALTPSSFGKTDAVTGQWIPKKFAGTYGTNGFYLKFADASAATAAAIGKDSSPNGNNWTPNNISVTSGETYDAMIDSPTLSGAASNYATLNPLDKTPASATITATNGNLQVTSTNAGTVAECMASTIAIPANSGKWYWECQFTTENDAVGTPNSGIIDATVQITADCYLGSSAAPASIGFSCNGQIRTPSGDTSYTNPSSSQVIGFAYDSSNGRLWVAVAGTWQNSGDPAAGTGFVATASWYANGAKVANSSNRSLVTVFNFGQRPFAYTPPTGFKSLNTFNLP